MFKNKMFRKMLKYFQKNAIVSKENHILISAVTDYKKLLSLLNN